MFRNFFRADARGSEKTVEGHQPLSPVGADRIAIGADAFDADPCAAAAAHPLKRRRPSDVDTGVHLSCTDGIYPSAKRARPEHDGGLPSPSSASADCEDDMMPLRFTPASRDLSRAADAIQFHFAHEILLRNQELRFINQELAKCQVALEQLRRCHLIPYPVSCPTPDQMLEISSGKGPALPPTRGQAVPKWAPPFGVVEGPYARHYAKWLIPDPMFDGIRPESQVLPDGYRVKSAMVEGRTTRNSLGDIGPGAKRGVRGQAGQKLQSLSSGYPPPKDHQGPCILKRSDGLTVKLVCNDCHRWNFSSTQGFINHCRIAHRVEFKSHDEAALKCGHPIEVNDAGGVVGEEKPPVPSSAPGLVHPLARAEPISEQSTCATLLRRIKDSLELYHAGRLPGAKALPSVPVHKPATLAQSSTTPYLSQLLQKKKAHINLTERVDDAKTKVDFDDVYSSDSDSDADVGLDGASSPKKLSSAAIRAPAVMRMPARTAALPSFAATPNMLSPTEVSEREEVETPMYEVDMDVDLSPMNTIASNNAPSLVSDDGEYDDSDDGSSSESSENMEAESVSDVAEIDIDDSEDTPRPIRRVSTDTAVKLRKEENKHVTFVTPSSITGSNKGRRKQKI